MVFNTSYTFSLKNNREKYDTYDFSLFDLEKINNLDKIEKVQLNNGYLLIDIRCIYCDEIHSYKLILNKEDDELEIKGCKYFGFPLLIFGEGDEVSNYILGQEQSRKQLYDELI